MTRQQEEQYQYLLKRVLEAKEAERVAYNAWCKLEPLGPEISDMARSLWLKAAEVWETRRWDVDLHLSFINR